ncbi:MAG: NAD(P)H-dependent oxidoreductase [Eubacterium sp.]|nr:NAD(P)H-dependent oxidoreductase [Eubacterium sp.]
MKKVVVLWSSPNTDGLTASAKNSYIKGLKDSGAEIEEIHLNRKNIEHCKACGNGWGTCSKTGNCAIQDDFNEIYRTLAEADGIVWISAVYWSDMTECLTQLERGLTHMGMRVYDRIPVVRYNKDYILPALEKAGETYMDALENGFDMYY